MATTQLARTRVRVPMVVPPLALVLEPVADLRADARDDAELVDQVHYREGLRVLASREAWHFVQASDHYFGWIAASAVEVLRGANTGRLVASALAPVHENADDGSRVIAHLPAGTPLATSQTSAPEGPWVWANVRDRSHPEGAARGYVALADAVTLHELPHRPPTAADLIATAEAFLGTPYLWGGTTALGIDCSGLVQQVYRLNGVGLDRDADQQALEGRAVDAPRAGDLVFFGETSVTHVGLAISETEMIHAPMRGGAVERAKIVGERPLRGIRRYLAE